LGRIVFLDLWRGCGQIPRGYRASEGLALVRAVAEGDVRGVAATAKRYSGSAGEAELLSFLIDDLEIAFDANRPIVEDGYLGCCHEVLREIGKVF
jgi:hypothetical protein